MRLKKYSSKYAFTLAEVLVTLLILGVVFAVTIPALQNSTQDQELKTAWKKAYAELSQATASMVHDNGGSLVNICTNDLNNCTRDLYKPYLKTTRVCDDGAASGNCWHAGDKWFFLDSAIVNWSSSSSFVSSSGMLYRFEGTGFPDCTNDSWVDNIPKCAFINVDVNGFKKPNVVGRDIFFMVLTKNRLLPVGTQGDGQENECNPSGYGFGCAAKYLNQ